MNSTSIPPLTVETIPMLLPWWLSLYHSLLSSLFQVIGLSFASLVPITYSPRTFGDPFDPSTVDDAPPPAPSPDDIDTVFHLGPPAFLFTAVFTTPVVIWFLFYPLRLTTIHLTVADDDTPTTQPGLLGKLGLKPINGPFKALTTYLEVHILSSVISGIITAMFTTLLDKLFPGMSLFIPSLLPIPATIISNLLLSSWKLKLLARQLSIHSSGFLWSPSTASASPTVIPLIAHNLAADAFTAICKNSEFLTENTYLRAFLFIAVILPFSVNLTRCQVACIPAGIPPEVELCVKRDPELAKVEKGGVFGGALSVSTRKWRKIVARVAANQAVVGAMTAVGAVVVTAVAGGLYRPWLQEEVGNGEL